MRTTTYRVAALAAATALALAACGDNGNGDGDSNGDSTAENGAAAEGDKPFGDTITIGTKIDQPGTGILIEGEYKGMDVDVAKEIAERLGYSEDDITWQESPTPQREDMLVNGTVDMIAATYSITDERKQRVQYAGPYFVAGQDLLVKNDSDITGPEDLDGKSLCSVAGSTPAERVAEEYSNLDIDLSTYDTYTLCMEALAAGRVDALTTDDVILAGYAAQDQWAGQFKVTGNTFSEELFGIGLNQDSEACEAINDIITEMWDDGTMEDIISENLGPADYEASDANPPSPGGHCAGD
ncbi:glutamate ABC transporter substrate-binding protein [Ornithinimicrobium sp. Y1847]|uniref:glutamate ABC transporter substrate-binding protein n=1 Tax=Ornithinimicrobium sp. Y1847 TaxID=3405419 RepID=UPI003B677E31